MSAQADEWQLPLLRLMLLSRSAGKREAMLIRQGKAHVHVSSAGHEALMALAYQLKQEDYLYPYYRGAHLILAKGAEIKDVARDFLAKRASSSQGRSMAAHFGSAQLHIFPTAAPTASQCLPAVGTAWGQKMSKQTAVTVCSIGDGATREGEFYEAVCMAVQYQLPIVFLVEDNHYAISTATQHMLPFRLNIFNRNLYNRMDGRDVFAVYEAAKIAIDKARKGQGPTILWCEVDRLDSHTAGEDQTLYRSFDELDKMTDPIQLYVDTLIGKDKLTKEQFLELEKEIQTEILQVYKLIELEEEPDSINIKEHLYSACKTEINLPAIETNEMTMVEAVNWALRKGLENNPRVFLCGQDIEDPKGGVFGFTKGLSQAYEGRVLNAPIAEATLIGTAVGLSVLGFKPVFEIQFIDFITPGFDQLVSQVSSLRWRSCSEWSCPLVLYAPYGAYLPAGGLWHSQSNEGWWAHIPGLRVAIPSTAQDTVELFWAAIREKDPTLILIPKHIFRKKMQVKNRPALGFGQARICQTGQEVTVIGWGNTVQLAEQAAKMAQHKGVSVEVLDLRSIVPCDWETIEKSLQKTGRLVVVHEDNRSCGFGGSLIANILSNSHSFNYLYTAPQLVAREDVHIPFHPALEAAVLPDVSSILLAIEKVMEE